MQNRNSGRTIKTIFRLEDANLSANAILFGQQDASTDSMFITKLQYKKMQELYLSKL